MQRNFSFVDRLIEQVDQGLRLLMGPEPAGARAMPAGDQPEPALNAEARALSGRLMRINHAGEVSAQALYQGQALAARAAGLRQALAQAAREENDHLAWTAQRVRALHTHTSYLNPLWYTGSLALGILAGVAGDRWSLGFLAETERQVVEHLDGHLARLPDADAKSRAVLEQMRLDEARHATTAIHAGAAALPTPVKNAMRAFSNIMTRTAFWF